MYNPLFGRTLARVISSPVIEQKPILLEQTESIESEIVPPSPPENNNNAIYQKFDQMEKVLEAIQKKLEEPIIVKSPVLEAVSTPKLNNTTFKAYGDSVMQSDLITAIIIVAIVVLVMGLIYMITRLVFESRKLKQ